MKEFKGTQGVWVASEDWDNDRLVIHQEDGIQWHVCYTPEYSIDNEQTKANATLIANAPLLLLSLQKIIKSFPELEHTTVFRQANAVINEIIE